MQRKQDVQMLQCEKQNDKFQNSVFLGNSDVHGQAEERREILARHEIEEITLSGGVKIFKYLW